MPTGATGQLGLALPVQGELSGTWGDTVNNGITQYTNIAIAATLTLTNDGAVTLANTTGDATASNITSSLTGAGTVTAQFAIVKVTGTLTTPKIITAPSYSKTYVVVNAATGSTVSFIRSGQTPAVSIAVGESAFVYFNGTDYVKLAGTVDTGVTSFTAGTTGFTPSTATTGAVTLAGTLGTANGGTNLTSFTSGGAVYATSTSALTTGTLPTASGGTNLTSFTSGGVVYASSSSALTTNSALTFDGSVVRILNTSVAQVYFQAGGGVSPSTNYLQMGVDSSVSGVSYLNDFFGYGLAFRNAGTEAARIVGGNVGIGTSSPSTPLDVTKAGGSNFVATFQNTTAGTPYCVNIKDAATPSAGYPLLTITNSTGATSYFRVDSSTGNVGIGKSPSAGSIKLDVNGVIADSNGNVRTVPQSGSSKTSSYTLATTDIGEYILLGASGAIVIPDATFAAGDVVTIFNNTASTATITCSITTAYIAGTFTDKATMTLAAAGVATVLFITSTLCVVSGNVT